MKKLELQIRDGLTEKQKKALHSKKSHLVIDGPAGTGKTYIALLRALLNYTKQKTDKIIIIRSPVEIRAIGYLPGDADEKLSAYAGPYMQLIQEISPKLSYKALVQNKVLEFLPTTFLRGLTFHDSTVLVDEFQNLSAHELETIVTRVGQNTNLILCGDTQGQSDLPSRNQNEYLSVFNTILAIGDQDIEHVVFTCDDIVRSSFVHKYYQVKNGIKKKR